MARKWRKPKNSSKHRLEWRGVISENGRQAGGVIGMKIKGVISIIKAIIESVIMKSENRRNVAKICRNRKKKENGVKYREMAK
jgi:hypothetical protein